MATIKYNGKEIQSITECKVFEEPREMLVWNTSYNGPIEKMVCAIIPYRNAGSVITTCEAYEYCAEIPEKPEPRRATNRELAKWLAQGNGEVLTLMQMANRHSCEMVEIDWRYFSGECNEAVDYGFEGQRCKGVRKWDDTKWHEPDVAYMNIEEDK